MVKRASTWEGSLVQSNRPEWDWKSLLVGVGEGRFRVSEPEKGEEGIHVQWRGRDYSN